MLQDLLTQIIAQISDLEALEGEFSLPGSGTPGDVIQSYLEYQRAQREIRLQLDDLKALRDMVQVEIIRIEAEERAASQKAEAEKRAQFVARETRRITGKLNKLDQTSPEAARLLLELSELRRG